MDDRQLLQGIMECVTTNLSLTHVLLMREAGTIDHDQFMEIVEQSGKILNHFLELMNGGLMDLEADQ